MPTLTAAKTQRLGGSVRVDYNAIWEVRVPENVSHDGQGAYSYTGPGGSTQEDIGTIRTVRPLCHTQQHSGLSSFEITIVDTGESNYIAVGVCDHAYAPNLLPGWEETSVAFHTDEGSLFVSSDDERALQKPCRTGDIIKCSLVPVPDHTGEAMVEFFRNEEKIAGALTSVPVGGLHGVIGMMSRGEKVQISPPRITKHVSFDQIWSVSTPHLVSHTRDGACSYTGTTGDLSVGTVRGLKPIDPLGPLQSRSFELRIVHPGEHRYIAVGVCSESYPTSMLPGWEESSIGYHADNGNLFDSASCGDGRPTDHPCRQGDVMRVTVHPVDGSPKEVCVEFHRNSQLVGQVNTWMPEKGFYACFGMMSRNEKVQVVLPEISVPYEPPKSHFSDVWTVATPSLQYCGNGICRYVGEGGAEHIGTLRSTQPLDPFGPHNSFEVKIMDPGRSCSIAFGVCAKDYPCFRLPGWDDVSIGFHADTGDILQSTIGEQHTSRPCRRGDVIRCSLEPVDGGDKSVSVVFHRNGELAARTLIWTPAGGLYGQIGAMGVGEVIQVASPLTEPSSLQHDVVEEATTAVPQLESRNPGGYFQFSGPPQQSEGFVVEGSGGDRTIVGGAGGTVVRSGWNTGRMSPHHPLGPAGSMAHAAHFYHGYPPRPSFHPPPYRHPRGYPLHPYYPPYRHPYHPPYHPYDPHSFTPHPHPHYFNPHRPPHSPGYGTPASQRWGQDGNLAGRPTGSDNARSLGPEMVWSHHGFGVQPDASTASPLPRPHPSQPPLVHPVPPPGGRGPRTGPVQGTEPVYASQTSVLSSASEQEAFQSQISTESAEGYAISGERGRSNSDTLQLLSGQQHSLLMHGSSSLGTLPLSDTHSGPSHIASHMPGAIREREEEACTPVVHGGAERVLHTLAGVEPARGPSDQRKQQPAPPGEKEAYHPFPHEQVVPISRGRYMSDGVQGRLPEPGVGAAPPGKVLGDYPDSPILPSVGGTFIPESDEDEHSMSKGGEHSVKGLSFTVGPQEPGWSAEGSEPALPHKPDVRVETIDIPGTLPTSAPPIARVIPREENKAFSILHHAVCDADGTLETALSGQSTENAFAMARLPLTEKLFYFEVELEHLGEVKAEGDASVSGNVAVGLVWSRYPPNQLPGVIHGSVAYHSLTGSLCTGKSECTKLTEPCATGDVIGCQATLRYKMEIAGQEREPVVEVAFFRNGCSIGTAGAALPSSGFHPAIGMTGARAKVKMRRDILLKPEDYFQTHPLPDRHTNFPHPQPVPSPWLCVRNAELSASNTLSMERSDIGEPAVVQSYLPMTSATPYFEVELLCPIAMYTVLAVGILPKIRPDSRKLIPGESPNSIGFLPRLGFIMRDGGITSAIPEAVTYPDKATIGLGIECNPPLPPSASTASIARKIRVFFTVNGQEVHSIHAMLPLAGGFHATVAADSDSSEASKHLAILRFPKHWPSVNTLPYGFIRGPSDAQSIEVVQPVWVRDSGGVEAASDDYTVRAIQAAYPLSPSRSYFEVCIVNGGQNYRISVGLASSVYPLNIHPGWEKNSIAIHADDGRLFVNADHTVVVAPCQHAGVLIGCGARFPDDGSSKFSEVFFTVDHKLIARRFVSVPPLGFFPTIGFRTAGALVMINMTCADPYPNLRFNTTFARLENVAAEGSQLQLVSQAVPGSAQLTRAVVAAETNYFEILPCSEPSSRIFIGYSTTSGCPSTLKSVEGQKSYTLEITSGLVLIQDQSSRVNETCPSHEGRRFGCGIVPIPGSTNSLVFFTVDGQVIYCTSSDLQGFQGLIYPYVYFLGSTTKVRVDTCALWPPVSPIGTGWARHAHLVRRDAQIFHSFGKPKPKTPVGFAQRSMPLTPSNPYFEVEVCSRAGDKAIAVGLASRRYPTNTWVGWKSESIAYHLDDGKIFKGNGNFGHGFGPKVFAGHTVGCGIKFGSSDHAAASRGGEKLEVFFTLNGAIVHSQKVSTSFLRTVPNGGFFPTVCLEGPSESIIYHTHSSFPPLHGSVGSEWCRAYSIHQAGRTLKHSCRHKELTGGIPRAFCQAAQPLSPGKPYFEVEITGLSDWSQICVGASKLVPGGGINPSVVDSMMYTSSGQLVTRRDSHKTTSAAQKFTIGDKLGCALLMTEDQPTAIEFFLNNMKVLHMDGLLQRWRDEPLHPTVILSHPGDAIIPSLGLPLPEWDRSMLIGWLRSERVKLRGTIVEYSGAGGSPSDVGVAQMSQPLQVESNPYYEVEILDPGAKCTIAVGLAAADYPLNSQPGWRANSVGYHGDDGGLFNACGMGYCFGPTWKKHDIIGVGVRAAPGGGSAGSEVQVYFTRNGEELGHTTMAVPPSGLFPTLGLHSPREKVKVRSQCVPSSADPCSAVWGTLCGLKASKPTVAAVSGCNLSYWDNSRQTPSCGYRLASAYAREAFSDSMQYFEVKILSLGFHRAVTIGVVPKGYSTDHAPGWLEGSIAYHTDSGHLHCHSGHGKVFGPVGRHGDTFGCGISFLPNNSKTCSIFFTYNGVEIGRVRGAIPTGGLYPAVCLTATQDKVSTYFHEIFKPKVPQTMLNFVGLMQIKNCSYSNQIVSYNGQNGGGQSPAMAQFGVPLLTERNYFAVNIVKQSSSILIGAAIKDYPLKYPPGYTSISVAYDVTNGSIRAVFSSESFLTIEAPRCEVGDTVGCGMQDGEDSKTDCGSIVFTRNGAVVWQVQLEEVYEELYPVVGMVPGKGLPAAALFMNWSLPVFEPLNSF